MRHLQESKELKSWFAKFGRAGIAERAIQLAKELADNPTNYFKAIETIGRMHALQIAARADGYWAEKSSDGYDKEYYWLKNHRAEIIKDQFLEVVECNLLPNEKQNSHLAKE